ncbi:MAG: flagellar basal body-associated FliL family protein [candidate division Zixibacteria bacterium]|nr:flagellar basal body-associated FliL family protein [candidate division Zixibacteria bacterium]
MADEDSTMVEVDENEESSKSGGSSAIKKYGILGGIVVVMIIAAWFVTAKIVKPMLSGGEETEQVEGETADSDSHGEEDAHAEAEPEEDSGGHGGGHGGEEEAGDANMILINNIVVNPAGTGGTRFLATSIGFELKTGKASSKFREKNIVVRDALITILSSQSIPELSDFKQRQRLRKLIKLRVQKLLKTDDVEAVYFTEFVLQ